MLKSVDKNKCEQQLSVWSLPFFSISRRDSRVNTVHLVYLLFAMRIDEIVFDVNVLLFS